VPPPFENNCDNKAGSSRIGDFYQGKNQRNAPGPLVLKAIALFRDKVGAELAGHPSPQIKGGVPVTRRVNDLDPVDQRQILASGGRIEEQRHSAPVLMTTSVGQIMNKKLPAAIGEPAGSGRDGVGDLGELPLGIRPLAAVENQPVDHRVKALLKVIGEFAAPPHDQRQIRTEVRKNQVGQAGLAIAAQEKGDLLGAKLAFAVGSELAARLDPAAHGKVLLVGDDPEKEGAASVVAGDLVEGFIVAGSVSGFSV